MHHQSLRRIKPLLCLLAVLAVSMPSLACARTFAADEGIAYLGYRGSTGEGALGGFRISSETGGVAYCIDNAASPPSGQDYTRQLSQEPSLARIVAAGYPARESAFGVAGDELRYATQVAIWQHLSQIRSVDVTRAPGGAFGSSYDRIRSAVDALVASGRRDGVFAPAAVYPSQCEAVLLENGSLVAGPFSVEAELGEPTYHVDGDASAYGCFPSDETGAPKSTFARGEEFYLSLDPIDPPRSLDATVSLSATTVNVTAWESPETLMQDLLEVETIRSSFSLAAQAVCTELVVVKSAEDSVPVEGTRFRIRDAKGGYDAVHEITAGDRIRVFGLRSGTYTIEEVDVPARYRVPPSQAVSLARGGTAHVVVRNELVRGSLSIRKHDARTGAVLSGASFALEESSAPGAWELVGSGDTDERGELVFSRLASGRYRVREVAAPTGYRPEESVREFTVERDGEVICMEFRNEPRVALPPAINSDPDLPILYPEVRELSVDGPISPGTIPSTGDSGSILATLVLLGLLSASSALFTAYAKTVRRD